MFSLDGGRIRIEAEAPRVRALRELETLDSAAERVFDEIARAAAGICETPIALVSLVDGHRQWFKARVGLDFTEADRAISFCSHAIESASELLVVRDTTADARFSRNTLVTGSPRLRFFAGAPLIVNGFTIGTLCVLDTKPRRLNARQKQTLTAFAASVATAIHYRQTALEAAGGDRERAALVDRTTGLPNREALAARIRQASAAEDSADSALLCVQIDRFRIVNEGYGRKFGDSLLRAVAERLAHVAADAYVARLESAAFALFVRDGAGAQTLAARLHDAFRAPFAIVEKHVTVTISIGVAERSAAEPADTLVQRADTALQSAKNEGGNRTVTFDEDLANRSARRLRLDRDVAGAAERGELFVVYQPVVDGFGGVVAVEALLRWQHPDHGLVPPDEFIPIAEANGSIVAIGRWVIRTACADLKHVRLACGVALRVCVNVSARQFFDAELAAVVGDALAVCGLDAKALEIEITESTIVSDPARATDLLVRLRDAGITVAIDDFGTGYSSLAALRRLPIDTLKIDRSFVAATPADSHACAIVDAILVIARQLALRVVAEGVETPEQAAYLRVHGCTMMQGYHFARPLAPENLVRFIKAKVALA